MAPPALARGSRLRWLPLVLGFLLVAAFVYRTRRQPNAPARFIEASPTEVTVEAHDASRELEHPAPFVAEEGPDDPRPEHEPAGRRLAVGPTMNASALAAPRTVSDLPPLVAAGVRVDEEGSVKEATFELVRRTLDGWETLSRSIGSSFEFYARVDARGEYAVRVSSKWLQRVHPIELGAEDLRLLLERPGGIVGRLLLGPGVDPTLISVDVRYGPRSPDEAEPRLEHWTTPNGSVDRHPTNAMRRFTSGGGMTDSGEFRVYGVAPGSLDLIVKLRGSEDPLALVDRVEVPAGGLAQDTRLEVIDLRRLRQIVVRVVDGDGDVVTRGELWRIDGGPPRSLATICQRETQLLLRDVYVDLEVRVPGHRPTQALGVDGDRMIALEDGLETELVLPDELELPRPPLALRVTLDAADRPPAAPREEHTLRERSLRLRVPGAGTYRPTIWVTDADRGRSSRVELAEAPTLEIRDSGQRFELHPDLSEIEAALERMTRRRQELRHERHEQHEQHEQL